MKNIHVLPTDKPSKIVKDDFGKLIFSINIDQEQNHFFPKNIYITSDEEIKEERLRWIIDNRPDMNGFIHQVSVVLDSRLCPEILLTTDLDLIADGVQAIDDEFLEWFVKNPSCDSVVVEPEYDEVRGDYYKIIIPKEEPKQTDEKGNPLTYWGGLEEPKKETTSLEEAAENYIRNELDSTLKLVSKYSFKDGAKWQQDQIPSIIEQYLETAFISKDKGYMNPLEWFEQFKKK